jgi:hypothetical protein
MKKLIYLLPLFLLFSCVEEDFKYKIKGKIYLPTSGTNPMHDAIWYADSIYYREDTLIYKNSDGSETKVNPPYKVYKLK